jgi:hypothetical protein
MFGGLVLCFMDKYGYCTSFATNVKVKTKILVLRIKILPGKNDRLSFDFREDSIKECFNGLRDERRPDMAKGMGTGCSQGLCEFNKKLGKYRS